MRLYLVRHGHAEDKAGKEDAARALTPAGRRDIAAVASYIAHGLESPVRVLSSPYLRAEQSAEILREALRLEGKLHATEALLPESDWPALRAHLLELEAGGVRSVIAVGHNPSISMICASIIAGSSDARIELPKGAVACIELDSFESRQPGDLRWLVTPGVADLVANGPAPQK